MRTLLVYWRTMWLVKKDFPDPLGPSMNLLRLVVTPFFMGKSDMSMCSGRPLTLSTILMPNGESELL